MKVETTRTEFSTSTTSVQVPSTPEQMKVDHETSSNMISLQVPSTTPYVVGINA